MTTEKETFIASIGIEKMVSIKEKKKIYITLREVGRLAPVQKRKFPHHTMCS